MAETAPPTPPPIDNLRGARWMVLSSFCFALSYATSKYLSASLPTLEIAFFRCLFGLTVIVPFFVRQGFGVYRTRHPGAHLIRIGCASASLILSYDGLGHLPLATAISLMFTRPLFMIVIALVFLGEVVRWRRGLATAIGFCGVLVVLGPHGMDSLVAASASLAGAAFTAGALAVVRRQAAVDSPATIMVWFATGSALATAIPAMLVWQIPGSLATWALLAFMGIIGTVGQFLMIQAFIHGEATVMNPIDYSQILFSVLIGYVVFNEMPGASLWLGAGIIVASTLYILLRESRLKKA
jgi:drug/metabolite transporter (DMT)-like permease